MVELVIPVDSEQAVIDALKAAGYTAVGTSVPDPRPPLFIRVVNVGGVPETIVSDAFTLTVEVYALKESTASTAAARVLATLVSSGLTGEMGSETCYRVGVMALPQNYPNPSIPSHFRYVMTLVPVLRRRALSV